LALHHPGAAIEALERVAYDDGIGWGRDAEQGMGACQRRQSPCDSGRPQPEPFEMLDPGDDRRFARRQPRTTAGVAEVRIAGEIARYGGEARRRQCFKRLAKVQLDDGSALVGYQRPQQGSKTLGNWLSAIQTA